MALTWDFTKCENSEELRSDKEWPVTEALIWNAMFTDIGWEITEKNAAEFYARISFLEKLIGASLISGGGEPQFITPEDVHKRIGLKVNVSPEARTKWANRKVKRFFEDAIRDYEKATKKEEVNA